MLLIKKNIIILQINNIYFYFQRRRIKDILLTIKINLS